MAHSSSLSLSSHASACSPLPAAAEAAGAAATALQLLPALLSAAFSACTVPAVHVVAAACCRLAARMSARMARSCVSIRSPTTVASFGERHVSLAKARMFKFEPPAALAAAEEHSVCKPWSILQRSSLR